MNDTIALRGADLVVQTLERIGVDRIFSLSGNHIMPIYDALVGSRIELVHCRHEAACVHMADAYARFTGRIGVALVTGGPGHTNAAAALYTALASESPMLLLSGHASTREIGRGAFQELRQADMVQPVTKASWTADDTSALGVELMRAARIARSGRPGPVHLSLPFDVLEQRIGATATSIPDRIDALAVPIPLEVHAADTVLSHVKSAQRPLLLCGPTLCSAAGREQMARLEALIGAPVLGMESPRGINDPSLGAFAQVLAKADLLVLLGKPLDFTLRFGDAPYVANNCAFMVIDPDAEAIARVARDKGDRLIFSAVADVHSGMFALIARTTPSDRSREWLIEARAHVDFRPAAWKTATSGADGPVHPLELCAALQALFDAHHDATLVCDGGEIGQWPQAAVAARHRIINGVAGSIGAALPYALAVQCARPGHPVIAVMGDGTFGFHMAELDTAVRYSLPVIVVIGNDARWNAEYQIQVRDYGPERALNCELLPTNYHKVAEALGGHGELVTRAADLAPALQRALAANKPACINVMIASVPAPNVRR
jgi:thiamine pyrophosphate-dependent acetolactate synthase large subunit-like protein